MSIHEKTRHSLEPSHGVDLEDFGLLALECHAVLAQSNSRDKRYMPPPMFIRFPNAQEVQMCLGSDVVNPQDREKIISLKQNFEDSKRIMVIAGTFGLGDSILDLRYVINLAGKSSNKPVICQAPEPLHGVLKNKTREYRNLSFVEKFDAEEFFDPSSHAIKFQSGELTYTEQIKCINEGMCPRIVIQEKLIEKDKNNRLYYWHHAVKPFRDADKSNFYKKAEEVGSLQMHDYNNALMLSLMGVGISENEILENSILSPEDFDLCALEQDIDYLIIPDAKEFEIKDLSRSKKSPELAFWDKYFQQLSKFKDKNVAIAMGVSHPRYCTNVINLAKKYGISVRVVEGNLICLAKYMLRSKIIIGMDSGTTHFALDVQRFAQMYGRFIEIRSVFFNQNDFLEEYGIVGAPTFLTNSPMDNDRTDRLIEFMI